VDISSDFHIVMTIMHMCGGRALQSTE